MTFKQSIEDELQEILNYYDGDIAFILRRIIILEKVYKTASEVVKGGKRAKQQTAINRLKRLIKEINNE